MKRHLVIVIVLATTLFLNESSWATGMFSPPEPGYKAFSTRKKGTSQSEPVGADFGIGYYTSKMGLKWLEPKLEQKHVYAHFGYVFDEDFYGYANIGASDMAAGDATSGNNLFVTLGMAYTSYNSGSLECGPVAQYSRYLNHDLKVNGIDSFSISGLNDITVGYSFAVKPMEWLKVQAVPFVYWARGDVEQGSSSHNIMEKNNLGGSLTVRFYPFGDVFSIDLETQMKSGTSYGAVLNYNY
jgi:hypothetical protein